MISMLQTVHRGILRDNGDDIIVRKRIYGEKMRDDKCELIQTVIFADEATASLDTNRAFEVVKLLAKETKEQKKATIMVTHDERMLEYCDKVYVIVDGVLSERKRK